MQRRCVICGGDAILLDSKLCFNCWRKSQIRRRQECWIMESACQNKGCSSCSIFLKKSGRYDTKEEEDNL